MPGQLGFEGRVPMGRRWVRLALPMARMMILSGGMKISSNFLRRVGWLTALVIAVFLTAALKDGPEADLAAGIAAFEDRDFEAAYAHWAPHAEAGHLPSQARLALLYSLGAGVEEDDERAVALSAAAAEAGLPLGIYLQAAQLIVGPEAKRDPQAALDMLGPLVECGMPAAQNAVAYSLNGNSALTPDEERAMDLYMRAAEQGYAPAQFNVAFRTMTNAKGDLEEVTDGMRWLILAANQDHLPAAETLERLKEGGLMSSYFELAHTKAESLADTLVINDPYGCSESS